MDMELHCRLLVKQVTGNIQPFTEHVAFLSDLSVKVLHFCYSAMSDCYMLWTIMKEPQCLHHIWREGAVEQLKSNEIKGEKSVVCSVTGCVTDGFLKLFCL